MAKKAISHINLIGALLVVVVFVFILSIIQKPSADILPPSPPGNCVLPSYDSLTFSENNLAAVGQNLITFSWEKPVDPRIDSFTLEIDNVLGFTSTIKQTYTFSNTSSSSNPFTVKNIKGSSTPDISNWSTFPNDPFYWRISASGSCDPLTTQPTSNIKTTTSTSDPIEPRTLSAGWNLIAPRGTVNSAINGALSVYSNNASSWYFTPSTQLYSDLDITPASSKIIAPGESYWVYSTVGGLYSLANVEASHYTGFTNSSLSQDLLPQKWTLLGNPFSIGLDTTKLSINRDSGTTCLLASPCSYTDAKNQYLVSSIFVWDPATTPPTGAWKLFPAESTQIPSGQGFFIKNKTTGTLHFKMQSS